ncbi:MAG: DUF4440 domain-containing protein [Alphaproteobacteria bacterium]|jgi:hypothetical protein|nr:DUF4440 domain-containing protein [Alphaproteobacteria bacterium]
MSVPDAVWRLERRLWVDGGAAYPEIVAPEAIMAFPGMGFMSGTDATRAMEGMEGWQSVAMEEPRAEAPAEGLALLFYRGEGVRPDGSTYAAYCTSTYCAADGGWRLVQHQQTPVT